MPQAIQEAAQKSTNIKTEATATLAQAANKTSGATSLTRRGPPVLGNNGKENGIRRRSFAPNKGALVTIVGNSVKIELIRSQLYSTPFQEKREAPTKVEQVIHINVCKKGKKMGKNEGEGKNKQNGKNNKRVKIK